MINTQRISIYDADDSPEARQFWWEARECRYQLMANEIIRWLVPDTQGHDDFMVSLALCARAADQCYPTAASSIIRSQPPTDETSRW